MSINIADQNTIMNFQSIAPYLSDPLILIGFFVFIFFAFCRYLIKRGVIPTLARSQGYRILRLILLYGFLFGIAIIGLGFGLKYRTLSAEEQRRAVALLKSELETNSGVVGSLAANLETLINGHETITHALRDRRIVIMSILFPESNLRGDMSNPTPRSLAAAALVELEKTKLARDKRSLAQADAAGKLVVGMIDRTLPTVRSLADVSRTRYVFRRHAYEGNVDVLRRIDYVDLTQLPATYANLDRVRASYEVVVANLIAYLEAVREFFSEEEVNLSTLTAVLTAERLSTSILVSYTPELVEAGEALREQTKRLLVLKDVPHQALMTAR